MSEKEFERICELDNIAEEAGGYVDFTENAESEVHYDYRAIIAYCRKNHIEPIDMTCSNLLYKPLKSKINKLPIIILGKYSTVLFY